MIRSFIFLFIFSSLLYGLQNSFDYSLGAEMEHFKDGHYDEVIRFSAKDAKEEKEKILSAIEKLREASNEVSVSIVAHASQKQKDQGVAQTSALELAESFREYLVSSGIDPATITVDSRGTKDKLFVGVEDSILALSERLMVSLYIQYPKDLDQDGVERDKDKCPDTKKGVRVGSDGCKLNTMVVLLQDEKQTSSVVVNTEAGSVLVDKPNQIVTIQSKAQKPSEPEDISKDDLGELLGDMASETDKKAARFTFYFKGNKLVEDSQDEFKEMLEFISQYPKVYIKITGYTDTVGTIERNDIVASKRAQKIKEMILGANLKFLTIDTESYSETNLAVPTADEVYEPLNRRAEVFLY